MDNNERMKQKDILIGNLQTNLNALEILLSRLTELSNSQSAEYFDIQLTLITAEIDIRKGIEKIIKCKHQVNAS